MLGNSWGGFPKILSLHIHKNVCILLGVYVINEYSILPVRKFSFALIESTGCPGLYLRASE